jgi:hypothetical protein
VPGLVQGGELRLDAHLASDIIVARSVELLFAEVVRSHSDFAEESCYRHRLDVKRVCGDLYGSGRPRCVWACSGVKRALTEVALRRASCGVMTRHRVGVLVWS